MGRVGVRRASRFGVRREEGGLEVVSSGAKEGTFDLAPAGCCLE